MKAHVFYFRWPGIKEGVIHKQVDVFPLLTMVDAPLDAFIFTDEWYWRCFEINYGTKRTVTRSVPPERVPAIFRTHLLLQT